MKDDILELNTNVKPTFMKYLLHTFNLEQLVYLDSAIFVYSPLNSLFEALDSASAVLTLHITSPLNGIKRPGEQDQIYSGTYNLGLVIPPAAAVTEVQR